MKNYAHLWHNVAEFYVEWEMFQTKVVGKIKTHILYLITFFRKSCRSWNNVEKYGRARQATDDNMRVACLIPKATDTLGICNIYWFFTATVVTRTRLNVTFIHTLPVLFHSYHDQTGLGADPPSCRVRSGHKAAADQNWPASHFCWRGLRVHGTVSTSPYALVLWCLLKYRGDFKLKWPFS